MAREVGGGCGVLREPETGVGRRRRHGDMADRYGFWLLNELKRDCFVLFFKIFSSFIM